MRTKDAVNPLVIVAVALVLLVVLGVVIWLFAANVIVGGHIYPKSAQFLNLRGKEVTLEDYAQLREKLPECDIYWDVPLTDGTFPENTQILSLQNLTDRDVDAIGVFEELLLVKAESCTDYAQLDALRQRYPGLAVQYNVAVGGGSWPYDTREVTLTSLTDEDISLLAYLPDLEVVQAGQCGDLAQVEKLKEAYPNLTVATTITLGGQEFDGESTEVKATGVTAAEAAALKYLPRLVSVHLTDPQMTVEELMAMKAELSHVSFTWEATVAGAAIQSDAREVELTGLNVDVEELKKALSYAPDLEMVFLNDCAVDNDAMAALREEKRSEYKVVWTVMCGDIMTRTDATSFMPIREKVYYFFDEDAENLKYCEDLVCVDLGHMSIHHVRWAASLPKLKYLILAHTQVSDLSGIENCKELVFLELDWSIVRDFTPLLGCTALEDLNIGKTFAPIDPILEMTWLKHLWALDRGAEAQMKLRETFGDTESLAYGAEPEGETDTENQTILYLNGTYTVGGIWRKLPNYYAMRDVLGMPYME